MKIILNGKENDVETGLTAFQLRDEKFNSACIVILNGFQISEDCTLKENDTIAVIEKGKMPSQDELESLMASRHTPFVHERFKKGRVAIAGLGGLGSNIAVMLARIGVGYLKLIDFDIVEPSNLNRQSYYIKHLGMFKTDALKQQIADINPFIKVETVTEKVTEENISCIFENCDIICEAFDNPVAKSMLVNKVMEIFPKKILVCGSGMAGLESSNLITTKRVFKNLYICGDGENEARQGRGLMAPRVSICAGHQANMIARLLTGQTDT